MDFSGVTPEVSVLSFAWKEENKNEQGLPMTSSIKNICYNSTIKVFKKELLQQKASISKIAEITKGPIEPTTPTTNTLLPDDTHQVPVSALTWESMQSIVGGVIWAI